MIGQAINTENMPGNIDQPCAPIRKSVELGLCNGFRLWVWESPPSSEFINEIIKEAGFVLVDFWIGTIFAKKHIIESGKSEEAFYDYNIQILKDAAEKYGDRFFWDIIGEPDSQGVIFPKEQFASKQQARQFCVQWIKDFAPNSDSNTKLRWYSYLKGKNVDLKAHNIAIHLGKPFMSHYAFEIGVRLVWVECNCGLPEGLQQTVAFTRGAANQFKINNTYWGIDFSVWNGRSHESMHYNEKGKRIGEFTESLYIRELMYVFLAGANLLHEEISDGSHWINKPKWYSKLSPMGKLAARFGKFTQTFKRGKSYRPVVVMLEHDHGWTGNKDDSGTENVWFGSVPTKKADLMIGQFFDLAFPGHNDYYSTQAAHFCQHPCKSVKEFCDIIASGKDVRSFEGGRLATSRWGDVIDVVLDDCPDDVLSEYKVLVLLGELKIDEKLLEKLTYFVKSGGTVIANVTNYFCCPENLLENVVCHGTQGRPFSIPSIRLGQVTDQIEQFVGFKFTGEKTRGSMSYCTVTKKNIFEGGFLYEKVQLQNATAIATCVNWLWGGWDDTSALMPMSKPDSPYEHMPIAVEHRVGKGKVITTLPYFMMHPVHRTPLQISGYIYDQAISNTLPYSIEGGPIQYMFNKVGDDIIVSLFNNGSKSWKGCIVSESKPKDTKFEYIKNVSAKWFKENARWKLNVTVPKFNFKIVTIGT
ncbi:MAG: hypothetical protein ACYC54_11480 [Sedimentisphaerales bacterium]